MFSRIDKFDQRILPKPAGLRILSYAIPEELHNQERNPEQRKHQQHQKHTIEEQVDISVDLPISPEEGNNNNVFKDITNITAWVPTNALLVNAAIRYRLICMKLDIALSPEMEPIIHKFQKVNASRPIHEGYEAYQEPPIVDNTSFQDKVDISNVIESETKEEWKNEHQRLETLIPGLQILLDHGYDEIPITQEQNFVTIVDRAVETIHAQVKTKS